ncbi:hypothetical protein C8C95_0193 [Acidovorax sp. 99]|uniref:hypothetical protein n=1 Tax=Acidovorax TaxID=12916 RepID=UPI000D5CF42D|nr:MULTISPECIES: hypothetical protein [Acidovorax]MDR6153886.1 hypothetical protein [Acidovorax delafieldii]PVY89392.1 hypothetical protein C8C95_0193 [Acidovorax sp. 99]
MAKQTVNQSLSSEDLTNIDDLSKKSAQLDALMYMTYGEGGEVFRRSSDKVQENYLWACAEIASEVRALSEKLALA